MAAYTFTPAAMEVRGVLRAGISRLEANGVSSATLAAELLLMHVLRCDRAWLYAHPEYELTAAQARDYDELVERRSAGAPTQYLTGRQEFWGLEFKVGPGVLIPRPETEHVVEVALERLGNRKEQAVRIADIGTGSGCLAIALAHEFPHAIIVATDISAAALEYARRNAERHGVSERIAFHQSNLLGERPEDVRTTRGAFDLVVSNPPYVARDDAAGLPREVREHEPAEALFAGNQGLDFYPALIEQAEQAVTAGGVFVAELGYNGAEYVKSLLSGPKWGELQVTRDLAGIERVISAKIVVS